MEEVRMEQQALVSQEESQEQPQDVRPAEAQQDTQPQDGYVPTHALEKMRAELQEIKRQNFMLQQQLLQQASAVREEPSNEPDDPLSGMDPDDVLTVDDARKLLAKIQQAAPAASVDNRLLKLQQTEAQMRAFYPDYDQRIERLIPIVKQNPALRDAILNAQNPAMLAYQLAETFGEQQQQPSAIPNAPTPAQVLQQPGTAARAGGSGAISPADKWLTMTPEEFEAEIARVKRG